MILRHHGQDGGGCLQPAAGLFRRRRLRFDIFGSVRLAFGIAPDAQRLAADFRNELAVVRDQQLQRGDDVVAPARIDTHGRDRGMQRRFDGETERMHISRKQESPSARSAGSMSRVLMMRRITLVSKPAAFASAKMARWSSPSFTIDRDALDPFDVGFEIGRRGRTRRGHDDASGSRCTGTAPARMAARCHNAAMLSARCAVVATSDSTVRRSAA